LFAWFALLAVATPAAAESELLTDAKRQEMTKSILEGDESQRLGQLEKLKSLPSASSSREYGNVVGPVLAIPGPLDAMDAAAAEHVLLDVLVDLIRHEPTRANRKTILLDGLVLRRLAASPALVEKVRSKMPQVDGTQQDWQRLLDHASLALDSRDAPVRRAAITAMSWHPPGALPDAMARIQQALSALAPERRKEDAAAYLGTIEALLEIRPATIEQALDLLAPFADRFAARAGWTPLDRQQVRADLERAAKLWLRTQVVSEVERQKQLALDLGRLLISRATGPEWLLLLFEEERAYPPELYRQALRHARTVLKPEPTKPWADLLVAALGRVRAPDVVEELIELLAVSFRQPNEFSAAVVDAVSERLRTGVGRDAIKDRVRLAEVLDGLARTAEPVRRALPEPDKVDGNDAAQRKVYERLIQALGGKNGAAVDILLPYYRAADGRPRDKGLRSAVARALGRSEGLDAAGREAVAAAVRHLLTGQGGEALVAQLGPREEDADVRAHLLVALDAYPTAESVAVFDTLASHVEPGREGEARKALEALGRLWKLSNDDVARREAGAALVRLTGQPGLRRPSLDLLRQVPRDLAPAHCASVCAPIRGLLGSTDVPEEEKALAADVLVALKDVSAFAELHRLWGEAQGEGREAAAQRMAQWFQRIAALERPDADQAVGEALRSLRDEGSASAQAALEWLKGVPASALARPALQEARLLLLRSVALDPLVAVETRRRLADEARQVVENALTTARGEEVLALRALLFDLLRLRATNLRAAEESAWALLRDALRAARSKDLARRGLELLGEIERLPDLTEEQRAELRKERTDLEALAAGT